MFRAALLTVLLAAGCGGAPPQPTLAPGEALDRLRAAVPAPILEHCEATTYTENVPAETGELAGLDCDLPRGDVVDYATYELFDSTSNMNAHYDTIAAGVKAGGNAEGAGCDAAGPGAATWEHGRALCYTFIVDDAHIQWTHEGLNIRATAFRDDGDFGPLIDWWRSAGPEE